ncbi:glycosyltransferase family 9 protein, partial [Vibrio rhizosphaerae]|uniref:glycosyltransferase family 9 protein n=1 Tax=Vibrio rhizosphaerae TaxID=398736 RepID=UPI0005711866
MKKNIIIVKFQSFRDLLRQKLGRFLFDRKNETGFDLTKTKSILFIRNDAKIGDAIVSSGVIRKIKKFRPDIRIIVMTSPSMRCLFEDGFGVNEFVYLKKRPSYSEIKIACQKLGKIDVAVSLNQNMKMKDIYLHRCLQTKVNIGLDSKVKLINKNISNDIKDKHYALKFDFIAKCIGIDEPLEPYIIPLSEASLAKIERFIFTHNIKKYIVFNPFGSGSTRKLNKENIWNIIEQVNVKYPDYQCVLLSSPGTRDEINQMNIHDNKRIFHFDDSESIYDAIAIVDNADLIITVDTSIVHIASGLGKKQIAIYRNDEENYINWGPNSDLAQSIFTSRDNINDIDLSQF